MSKHTPAPWLHDSELNVVYIKENNSGYMQAIAAISIPDRKEERLANGNLIAAAPELLDALQLTLKAMRGLFCQIKGDSEWNFAKFEIAEQKAQELITKLT